MSDESPLPHLDFAQSMLRIRSGSEEAVWELIERFGPHVHRVVRRRLDPRLRSQFDSLDFVQMVWASFFRRPPVTESPDDLIRYLTTLARRKVTDQYRRRLLAQKADVRRETPLDSQAAVGGRLPRPSEVARAREIWQQLTVQQEPRHRQIVQLRLQGQSFAEIAEQLGLHERTVRRIVKNLSRFASGQMDPLGDGT